MKVSPAQIAKTFASTATGTDVATQAGELINYLQRTGRMGDASTIVELVQEELDRASGTIRATVTTAQAASAETRALLDSEVAREFPGKRCNVSYVVNPDLVGGYQVEADGQLIDASVRQSLRSFSPTFS